MRYLLSFFIIFQIATAKAMTLVAEKGSTSFLAVGRPSALKIKGQGEGPTGELTLKKALEKTGDEFVLTGDAILNLESLNTGISLRDQHMKEKYLEVHKYKLAKLKFLKAVVPTEKILKGGELNLVATLELHGHENPVEVKMNISPKGDEILSHTQFKLKLSDYGIVTPKYLGVIVADEVSVTADTLIDLK